MTSCRTVDFPHPDYPTNALLLLFISFRLTNCGITPPVPQQNCPVLLFYPSYTIIYLETFPVAFKVSVNPLSIFVFLSFGYEKWTF